MRQLPCWNVAMDDAKADRLRREFRLAWVWLARVASVAVGVVVAVLLWGSTRAEHRDAFDTGGKSAAAVLAILAAFVTVERLRLGQREHHRQVAADQAAHITDLSSKASEQLGSEKAAVRIGGLTDLERLAQSYPELRQTVVDRICAYLRAPYQPPPQPCPP
jgi:ABC-type transport system involved in cytochrome bd biosynthesis fused ATPase/permease subunit